jgi:hypothetical protein
MGNSTIYSADAATDVCTITGHGFVLAQKVRTVATFGGSLPGGLAEATDYFVIPIDANTFKLATSSANAIAGTAINITSNGSSPTMLFGLPYVRPITYAAGLQVRSKDINQIFDAFSEVWNLTQTDTILGVDFVSATNANVTYDINTGRAQTTAAVNLIARIPLRSFDRLKQIQVFMTGDSSVDVTLEVWQQSNTSHNLIGSGSASNVSSTTVTIDVTDTELLATTGGTGDAIYVNVIANATGLNLYNVRYTYDRPFTT